MLAFNIKLFFTHLFFPHISIVANKLKCDAWLKDHGIVKNRDLVRLPHPSGAATYFCFRNQVVAAKFNYYWGTF